MENRIPDEILKRTPLFKSDWMTMLKKMSEHAHAPVWNTKCGDRLMNEDIKFIQKFEKQLHAERSPFMKNPGEKILKWINETTHKSQWFENKLDSVDYHNHFYKIPFMERKNIKSDIDKIVADDDFDRLIINPTSGTTGELLLPPSHPKVQGCYDPLIQFILKRHGVEEKYDYTKVAAIQICAQDQTITYNTVHSYLDGAGFAKINLNSEDWKEERSAELYISDMAPVFLSGDPFSFVEYMKRGISYKPKIILTTAITLEKNIRKKMEDYFKCPVADMYSLNETGPIAYSCPHLPEHFHILPSDIFVETVRSDGTPTDEGEVGEIVVTGGRNPYIPLLRYKTGDYGILMFGECSCGDSMPAIKNLTARKLINFYRPDMSLVNPIDISRVLSRYPVLCYQFIQKKNFSCELKIKFLHSVNIPVEKDIIGNIGRLFDGSVKIHLKEMNFTGYKVIPFVCEIDDAG